MSDPAGSSLTIVVSTVVGAIAAFIIASVIELGFSGESLVLVAVILFAFFSFWFMNRSEDRMEKLSTSGIEKIESVMRSYSQVKLITDSRQIYSIEDDRLLKEANHTIRMLGCGVSLDDQAVAETTKSYVNSLGRAREDVVIRRIQIMSGVHLAWLEALICIQCALEKPRTFELRIMNEIPRQTPNLVIVDDKEAEISIFDNYFLNPARRRGTGVSATLGAIYIRDVGVVGGLVGYFDALWESDSCTPVDLALLRKITDDLRCKRTKRLKLFFAERLSENPRFSLNAESVVRELRIPDRDLIESAWQDSIA